MSAQLVADYAGKNPRWVCWMLSRGEDPATFVSRDESGEVRRIDGRMPWTVVFMQWVQDRLREWATGLGFADRNGRLAHEVALLERGHDAFDAWLRAKVGAS